MAEFNLKTDPNYHPDHRSPKPDPWAPKPSAPADKTAAPGKAPREDVVRREK